jgi:hypothetical protein
MQLILQLTRNLNKKKGKALKIKILKLLEKRKKFLVEKS